MLKECNGQIEALICKAHDNDGQQTISEFHNGAT